ncbi:MAG: hypothetical protein ACLP01_15560 [Solirubrobacteraceae bacterium]
MSTAPHQPSEEELRTYEEEIKRIRIEHVLLEGLVTLVNLGMRRTGLMPGTEGERDAAQVRLAIEAIRAHIPVLESVAPEQVAAVRDALSQLQLAYVRIGGAAMPGDSAAQAPAGAPTAGHRSAEAPAAGEQPAAAPAPGQHPAGAPAGAETAAPPPPRPGEPGPAQRSGRLWVPDR